ncbi:MAG TPA: DUF2877 domain-containing protein [Thermaerobacter sp.]
MPATFCGRVVAVFDYGFYGLDANGRVIVVGDRRLPPGPLHVRLPQPLQRFRAGGEVAGAEAGGQGSGTVPVHPHNGGRGDGWRGLVTPGQRVVWDAGAGVLAVEGRVWLAFEPRALRRWHLPPVPPAGALGQPGAGTGAAGERGRAARVLGHLLAVARRPGWLPFRAHVSALVRAAAAGDWLAACRAADMLLGAGPGLTPSGDDWLAGFAAYWAAWMRYHRPAGAGGRAPRGEAVRGGDAAGERAPVNPVPLPGGLEEWRRYVAARAPHRTSAVGAAFLIPALEGELPEPAASLLVALLTGQVGEIPARARQLLRTGHHSGVDLAWGLWMAARWLESGQRPS